MSEVNQMKMLLLKRAVSDANLLGANVMKAPGCFCVFGFLLVCLFLFLEEDHIFSS